MEPALKVVSRLKQLGEDQLFEEVLDVLEAFWCEECGFSDIPGVAMDGDKVVLFCPDCNDDDVRPDPIAWKA